MSRRGNPRTEAESMAALQDFLARKDVRYACWDCNWAYWGQSETERPGTHAKRKGHRVIEETTTRRVLLP